MQVNVAGGARLHRRQPLQTLPADAQAMLEAVDARPAPPAPGAGPSPCGEVDDLLLLSQAGGAARGAPVCQIVACAAPGAAELATPPAPPPAVVVPVPHVRQLYNW